MGPIAFAARTHGSASGPLLEAKTLLHEIGARLAGSGVLIAGAAAATDRADQLAALDQRQAAGRSDHRRIDRGDVGMTGFEGVVVNACFTTMARCRPGLALRNGDRRE